MKKLAETIKQNPELLELSAQILGHHLSPMVWLDLAFKIIHANPAFCRRSGYSCEDLSGSPFDTYLAAPGELKKDLISNTIQSGKNWTQVVHAHTRAGSIILDRISILPLFDSEEKFTHMMVISNELNNQGSNENVDFSALQQISKAQRLQAIGTLAGGIAHDFNNILTPIFGYASMGIETLPKNHEVREDLEEILHAAQRAKELVSQLLTFSRSKESGRARIRLQPLIKETLKLLKSSAPTHISLQAKVEANLPEVYVDPAQIHQMLVYLFNNAVESMEDQARGHIWVKVSRMQLNPEQRKKHPGLPGTCLHFTIQDEGCGIPSNLQHQIFDPFFSTKRGTDGSGMGLPVVHGIVMNHGGEIIVESEAGKGTTVQIFLPAGAAPTKSLENTLNVPTASRILVVDDDSQVLQLLDRLFQKMPYEVKTTLSANEACEILQKSDPFDLLITDVKMPGMSGVDLARFFWQSHPARPVLFMSGFADISLAELSSGHWSMMEKPLVVSQVKSRVHELLVSGQ